MLSSHSGLNQAFGKGGQMSIKEGFQQQQQIFKISEPAVHFTNPPTPSLKSEPLVTFFCNYVFNHNFRQTKVDTIVQYLGLNKKPLNVGLSNSNIEFCSQIQSIQKCQKSEVATCLLKPPAPHQKKSEPLVHFIYFFCVWKHSLSKICQFT